jgi:DNA-binding GntR family transcriptional regulator
VHKAIQVARAISAPETQAAMLGVAAGSPLLLLERTFLTRDGSAIEHAQIFSRSDRYRQLIEFYRRGGGAAEALEATAIEMGLGA